MYENQQSHMKNWKYINVKYYVMLHEPGVVHIAQYHDLLMFLLTAGDLQWQKA